MHALLDKSDLMMSTPITTGDCGVVLKPDGTFKIFSTGVTSAELTPEQRLQGTKLVCLALALKTPAIMDMLENLLNDPSVNHGIDVGPLN